jgi:hypothetical protein
MNYVIINHYAAAASAGGISSMVTSPWVLLYHRVIVNLDSTLGAKVVGIIIYGLS